MNSFLVAAASIAIITAMAHSILGESLLIGPLLRRDDLPALIGDKLLAKRTLRFVWHLPSIAWLGIAALLLMAPAPSVLRVLAATALASGVVTALISRGKHPGWIAFVGIAVLTWLAT